MLGSPTVQLIFLTRNPEGSRNCSASGAIPCFAWVQAPWLLCSLAGSLFHSLRLVNRSPETMGGKHLGICPLTTSCRCYCSLASCGTSSRKSSQSLSWLLESSSSLHPLVSLSVQAFLSSLDHKQLLSKSPCYLPSQFRCANNIASRVMSVEFSIWKPSSSKEIWKAAVLCHFQLL